MISTGGEGKVSGRKRLRGKIGNPSRAPEIKSINAFASIPAPANYFGLLTLNGVYSGDPNNPGVWTPVRMYWPVVGAENYQRIGKKIRVKYLRFKGYCASSPFLIQQVRYRIVLYRLKKHVVQNVEVYNQAWLKSLYKSYSNMDEAQSITSIQNYAVLNYYVSFMNPDEMKSQDCKRRVLFKGILKPSPDIGNILISSGSLMLGTAYPVGDKEDKISGQVVGNIYEVGASGNPDVHISFFNAKQTSSSQVPDNAAKNVALTVTHNALSMTTNSTAISMSGEYQLHVPAQTALNTAINSKSFFPIDFVVNMNDNIDCDEYTYICVIESDVAVGQNSSGNFSNTGTSSNFYFVLTPHLYYTDD